MSAQHFDMMDAPASIAEEDLVRARLYRFLARLLARPAGPSDLERAAGLDGDESDLGCRFGALAAVARRVRPEAVSHEYHDLFIGLGRGELVPYASYYLTGFLNEKPLARLRAEMADLGIERDPSVSEPEDHIAALMDMMAGLILGDFGDPADVGTQRDFFRSHISTWAGHFFRDLEQAESSVFYAAVAGIGRAFLEIEETAFAMD